MELYEKQRIMKDFGVKHHRVLNFSDAGTGKTAATLHTIKAAGGKTLVMAPKAILESAWVDDCHRFTPGLSIVPAYAANRADRFKCSADIVVTNHDAATWMRDNPSVLRPFDTLVIDESTAFKTPTSARSKSMAWVRNSFERRIALTGTPMSNGLRFIWHQAFLIDDGERLGDSYYRFLNKTHDKKRVTRTVDEWVEREGMREAAAMLLSDITVRFSLDECQDIPPQAVRTIAIELAPKVLGEYNRMASRYVIDLNDTSIVAANAAVMTNKLLQISSGAVYDNNGEARLVGTGTSRYDQIAQLCAEREHTLVAFVWKHQRDGILKALKKLKIDEVGIIDSDHSGATADTVRRLQAGKLRVVLAQPASASHGLTMIKAKTIIWASPTYDAERYQQFNRRVRRTGQTEKTEVINIIARGTLESAVHERACTRAAAEGSLLDLLRTTLNGG